MGAPWGEEMRGLENSRRGQASGLWERACVGLGGNLWDTCKWDTLGQSTHKDTAALESLRSCPRLTLVSSLANALNETTVL